MSRKVILDVDPGIDDAVAMTLALFHPGLEVLAVTAVGGNVAADKASRNVQAIVEQLDPPRRPRVGAASPPDHGQAADSRHLFGADGLGEADFDVAELHHVHASEKVLADEIRAAPEDVTVLALGPLTNVARALQRDPGLAGQMGQLIISGGSVSGSGNVTPAAEFNIFCDPLSARAVFRQPITKTLIPLDVTRQIVFDYDLLDQLPRSSSRAGAFLEQVLPFLFRSYRQSLGLEGILLPDTVALLAAIEPELFETQMMEGDVETAGELTTGATVFDRRGGPLIRPNIAVATAADVSAIRRRVVDGLQAARRA